jgi:hypothetical protein
MAVSPLDSDEPTHSPRTGLMLSAALAVIVLCSTGAIVATYSRLSHTWDEGTHLAAGIELLQDGRYTLQTENPPLSRVVLAVVPYLNGARLQPSDRRSSGTRVGADLFYRTPDYVRNVTEARLGNLPFFWACVALTWVLAGGRSDPWVAFLASAAVATLPPIVAHSGLATTDVAFVASVLFSLVALRRFLNQPALSAAALLGTAVGVAVATKFSSLVFLPPVAAAVVIFHYWDGGAPWNARFTSRWLWKALAVAGSVAVIVIWASYGFDVGRLTDLPARFENYGTLPTSGWAAFVRNWQLPGHEFIHGLLFLQAHTSAGHPAILFDHFSQHGFLLFYPVVLATKTPIPFLLFAAAGVVALVRYRDHPRWTWFAGLGAGALVILLAAMNSPINLGVRHVLVIYPLVALAAAFGLVRWAGRWRRPGFVLALATASVVFQLALLLGSVPDQITYFNAFAGSEPAYVSSDSDFDWGQDGLALERYFAEHPVPELFVLLNGTTKTCSLKLPPVKALPTHRVAGWIAMSEHDYRLNQGVIREDPCELPGDPGKTVNAPPGWLNWLRDYKPVAVIGKTVRLYHIPEPP